MKNISPLESAVLEKLLFGEDPTLSILRAQTRCAHVASRQFTGAGFYLVFGLPEDAPKVAGEPNFEIGDVHAKLEGLQHGAGFVLFIKNGRLDMLEGYSYDEPWPTQTRGIELFYERTPRELRK